MFVWHYCREMTDAQRRKPITVMKCGEQYLKKKNEYGSGLETLFYRNWFNFALSLVGILFKVTASLGFSAFIQKVLDTISHAETNSIAYLITFAAVCIFCLLTGAVLEYVYWTAFRSRALLQYRENTYQKILGKNVATFRHENTAKYISALSNDLEQIKENYLESLPYMAETVLGFVGTVIIMLYYDATLAAIAFGISLIPIIVSLFRLKEVASCEERLSAANSAFLGVFSEVLHGFRAIKSMKAEKSISAKLLDSNKEASSAFRTREHIEISVAYIASVTGYMAQIAFFFISMLLSRQDSAISAGVIIVFVQLMQNIIQLAVTMPELIARIKAAKRLIGKNDERLMQYQSAGVDMPVSCKRKIELTNVSVCYGSAKPVLDDLSVELLANGCYAILGESGSGKTTLLNLLTGANRDYTGNVKFDETDIRNISGDSLFQLMSVIYQDVFIFDATIEENITMFGSHDDAMLADAIRKAGLTEMIEAKGLSYRCGENGNMLSGGEKQRIGIARSVLQGADVLFFDEATSALDMQTGYQIMDTVLKMEGKTRIVITHDIYEGLMDRFDCIFVLKNGRFAEAGKYNELIAKKGVCYELLKKDK